MSKSFSTHAAVTSESISAFVSLIALISAVVSGAAWKSSVNTAIPSLSCLLCPKIGKMLL